MACVQMKIHWGKKKARLEGREAGFELQQFLPSEAQGHQRQEPKGHSSKLSKIAGFLRVLRRNKGDKNVTDPPETSKGFSELVQDGQFLEAYLSIPTLVKQGQDCKSLYQVVAQSMWQVLQQALEGTEYCPELELKIQAVLGTIEWTQEKHQSWEDGDLQDGDLQDGDLQDGGVAAWGNQLEKLLRSDVEARVPALGPGDQVDLYLEKLEEAVTQGLRSPRASLLGPQLWKVYRTHFQEVLLNRLWELMHSFGTNRESCHMLYSWAKITLFGEPGKTLVSAPPTSQEPAVRHLLDSVTFVPWMSRMQKKLVGLIQESLEEQLENVLICDWKTWAQASCPTFIEIFQLLEENINAVQPIGLPITSQVQSMVLETFSKFLKRYEAEAAHFLHQNATAGPLPEVHVLANCCILRETWQELSWAHILPAHLDAVVQDTIHDIESHSRDHFLFKGRALCKSLLLGYFVRKDKDLVGALEALWQSLEGRPKMYSTLTYEDIMRSLHVVVFGEYIQALATHLKKLAPKKWEDILVQVNTDTTKLHNIFTKHRDVGLANLQEPIMGIFQLRGNKGRETVDDWLASFRDRFPDYLSTQAQPCCSVLLEETEDKGSCCCCC
ncbi:uncharacterized protein LOC112657267 isoform X1 [Canis lupus dingo]|uniref:uncharacterized protein LOC112657267 isoform X1 n=1 Tax=Canis lupus dingo TaxID=286419 RepID=UPI000DC6A216|nr:uncharacterized protein LOC112657267 isoform X1 [Canis lupus dingo]XP_025299021.1 uncharacterized protein LOC112657267 isoform X1 [Canis lupus dingo]XP_035575472.1 uncharacterized protein LOC112657267 isoform X1 [Canis lupus dingo]XP_038530649.1 uncharacterized protein LOC102154610 isoform X1 [Canis lupus familiaris]XP_038530650.1 uncharacterized protein LOC102154610 isoform X1 [Canis lupus familiaris]XP_038530651.1 uncharacterized protein LOC102154610 isoform X1 [Canis lupus familiaris]